MSLGTIASLVAGAVGLVLALVFGLLARRDRKKGAEALAQLEAAYARISALTIENARLRKPITTAEERQAAARAELDLRRGGVPEDSPDAA